MSVSEPQSPKPDTQKAKPNPFGRIALQLYRAGILALLAFLAWHQRIRLQIEHDSPVKLKEVQAFLPEAARLEIDTARKGQNVLDAKGKRIGYAACTLPVTNDI